MLCRYRLYIGSIAARLQCVRTTIPGYTQLANHMPQYYIVSYSISMLMSTMGSPKSLTLLHSLPLNLSISPGGGLLLFLVGYRRLSLSVDFSIGFLVGMLSVCSDCVSVNSGWLGVVGTESSLVESFDEIVFSALTSK